MVYLRVVVVGEVVTCVVIVVVGVVVIVGEVEVGGCRVLWVGAGVPLVTKKMAMPISNNATTIIAMINDVFIQFRFLSI